MRPQLIDAISRLHSGDTAGVGDAMQLLQGTVYAFSMKVCGHPEDAEDTMQEVLMRSLPHLARIGDPRALAVWLYTVTRNRCWRMRRKGAHAPKQMLSLDELAPDGAELGRLLEDRAKGPEALLLDGEKDRLLQKALLALPAAYRMVLVLHDMEELTAEQVAQVLDLKPGTVRVRLHRARLALRRQMSLMIHRAPVKHAGRKRRTAKKAATKRLSRPVGCRELFANLSEYLDGRLEPASCEQMRAHIESCPPCVAFIDDLRSAIERCHALQPKCDEAVASRLQSILTAEYLRLAGNPAIEKTAARGYRSFRNGMERSNKAESARPSPGSPTTGGSESRVRWGGSIRE